MENPTTPRRSANPQIDAEPITQLELPRTVATGGRPKKLKPMPVMEGLSQIEQVLFDDFIKEYLVEYPDITDTDYRMLYLVAVKYIQVLRVSAKELKTGKVLAMARQNPSVEMRALQDQLSITRKARVKSKPQQSSDDQEALRDILFQLGKN